MSHQASRLAWLTKEPQHGAQLVLALADHHNATTNECYPSVARLAKTTLLERKAVIRELAELERLGAFGTERKNGFVDQPAECPPDAPETGSAVITPSEKKNPATVPRKLRNKSPKDRFEEFLNLYPKRTKQRDEVRKAWLKFARESHNQEDIIADVIFRKTTDDWTKDNGKWVPSPRKYLKRIMWIEPAAEIGRLAHELDRHPGNHNSIHHNPQASPEVIEDFKAKRTRLNKLRTSE